MSNSIDRRKFIGVGAVAAAGIMVGCSANGKAKREMKSVSFLDQAPDGKEIKAGLIGCGGRGTGAAINFLEAGSNLKTEPVWLTQICTHSPQPMHLDISTSGALRRPSVIADSMVEGQAFLQ